MKRHNPIKKLMDKIYRKHPWNRGVTTVAGIIVFVTTYMLILPAITLTPELVCPYEENHIHTDACYRDIMTPYLDCEYVRTEGVIVVHAHDERCYEDGVLICPLQEIEAHVHTGECYAGGQDFSSGAVAGGDMTQSVSAETVRSVGDTDFSSGASTDNAMDTGLAGTGIQADAQVAGNSGELICGKTELIPHLHGVECYDAEGRLICDKPVVVEHQHTVKCISWEVTGRELICGQPEGHVHGEECYDRSSPLAGLFLSTPETETDFGSEPGEEDGAESAGADAGLGLQGDVAEAVPAEAETTTDIEEESETEVVSGLTTERLPETTEEQGSEPETGIFSEPATEGVTESAVEEGSESETEIVQEAVAESISEYAEEAFEIETETISEAAPEATTESVAEPSADSTAEAVTESDTEATTDPTAEGITESDTEVTTDSAVEALTESVTEAASDSAAEVITESDIEVTTDTTAEVTAESDTEETTDTIAEVTAESDTEVTTDTIAEVTAESDTEVTTEWTNTIEYRGGDYTVRLTYDDLAGIPADAILSAEEIAYGSPEYDVYLAQTKAELKLSEEKELPKEYARFFDIKILDGEEEIEPTRPVRVEIVYDEPVTVAAAESATVDVLHFDEKNDEIQRMTVNPGSETIGIGAVGEQAVGQDGAQGGESALNPNEKPEGTTGGEDASENGSEAAGSGMAGSEMAESEPTESALAGSESTGSAPMKSAPMKSVSTGSESKDTEADQAEASVQENGQIVEGAEEKSEIRETEGTAGSENAVVFTASGFSVYGVIYTVDFHYEVNGKMYEFSIPGGGFVSLEHVVEVLGIARIGENTVDSGENALENGIYNKVEETGVETIDENTGGSYEESISLNNVEVSEATKQFVADVASVEFSSPELVWVGKVENETTVGGLKEANGLEVQYSAELTEEQITEINSSTVEAGDWALISMLPFTSEESLTVTMKNGDQFVVKVTDAQISTMFLTDSGELFEVTVTYNDDAKIPDGATLKVTEFDEYSQEFQNAWRVITGEDYFSDTVAAEMVSEETPDGDAEASEELSDEVISASEEIKTLPAGMAAMDITIYDSEDYEVEPKAPVSVSIVMKSLPEDIDTDELGETAAVHHLNETHDGTVEETVVAGGETAGEMTVLEESLEAGFVVDSFSTYTITWGSATNTTTNLRLRENNNNRAQITVHYVDQEGHPISRPSGINANTDQTVSWSNNRYTYNITESNIARTIPGYSYQGAHAGSYDGTEISSVTLQRISNYWSYNYSTDVNSVYLVYSGVAEGITVHYGYMDGGTFVEFSEDEDGDVPAGTTVPRPSQYGDQWDLEMNIPEYRYVTTRINDPANGREISSLLNTDPPYVANTNNTFENANLSAYPSYTSSTAPTSFVSEWRYRQLSSIGWNPEGSSWNYSNTEPVTGYGVTKPVSFADTDKDIYVIYEKGSMSGGSGDDDDTDLGKLNAPTTDKQVDSNHDGTYDVTLSAKGEKKNTETSTKANVVIVLDTSWSMYGKDAGDGQSRLSVAQSAIGSLADKLFALNEEESDTIELAFVNFAQRVRNEEEMRTIYSGTDATSFKNMINGLDCASGTNWDDALYAADHIYFNDNDPTYVVFITDGDPISCAHPYGTYSDWDGGTYYNVRSNYEYALAAKNQADLIIAHNKTLYTIGAFGEIANLQAIGGTYLGQANNTTAINGYFDDIISDIQSALGYQDITINDGITALSSTGLARGDITSLRYYRSGGENTDGSEKYDHTANDGHGVEWEDAPDAYLLEVKSENGVTKYYKNGSEAALSSLTDLTEEEYLEKYPVGTRTVVWDINANSEELLEDGVTYTMVFTMWPSQEAYDLIADLNNGVINYDDDLSQAEKDQVYLGDDNVYYLKTNTKATVDYTSVKLVNGEVSGTPTTASAEIEDPKGKMNLDSSIMTVSKEFAHLINEADPYEEIVFYLLVDGKYYNKDGTLSDTLDESEVYAINLPKDGKWEDTIYIAPGLMRGGDILETGHNYSLAEKIVSGNPYEYEFAPQTVRPMVITAVPTFLVKKDSFNTNTENKQEYTFNDADSKYVVVDGHSDAADTYYAASENDGSLTGVNHKTSELDITKIIKDPQNLLTDAQEAAETFTYRVTLQIPDGCDPSGIVGYEYVPRTQSNAFTLFGYQTGQSAYAEDIARFSSRTFRAWNTLVYDALVEYDRVTENGNTFIKVRRDEDGNIIWKVPASNGYHTITYDMTLKQDEVIRFTNLPTGTRYSIQEIYANKYPADNAGGKTDGRAPVADESNLSAEGYEIERVQHTGGTLSADQTTVEGTIEAPDTRYYNQFTNRKVTESEAVRVELKVKKVVEDYTWGQEYYRFTLSAGEASYTDTEGGTGTSPMPDGTQNSAVSIYNSTAEHTLSFGTVRYTRPGTYTYTVSEYDNSRNMPDVQFASPVTITVTVTADDSGKLVVENVEDDQGTTVYSAETGSALAAGLTTQTNTTKKIHIRKVDKNNPNTVLADAVFEIRSGGVKMYLQDGKLLNAEAVQEIIGMPVSADGAEAAMASEKISSTFTLGEIDISGFSYDAVYELKEITPPDGYIIVNGSTYFKAVHNNTQTYLRLTDQNGTVLADDDNNPILENDYAAISENGLSISVKNEPGVALPNTGGPGTQIFTILGSILILGAGVLLWRRRRTI